MEGRRRRRIETRKTSSEASGSTGDDSDKSARLVDLPVMDSNSVEWTDEKHSLYLKSMEASFVDQLYNSMDLGWNLQKEVSDPKLPPHVNCDNCASSGQFKVLRHGVWQKKNFQNRPESQRNLASEPRGLLSSPWVQHFISVRNPQVVPSSTIQEAAPPQMRGIDRSGKKATSCGSTSSSKHSHRSQSHSYHRNMVDSNTEVSDQNFVDEDVKGGKTSACSSKRIKTLVIGAPGGDQVVPCGKPPMTDDPSE